jgi:hypothetical protein
MDIKKIAKETTKCSVKREKVSSACREKVVQDSALSKVKISAE